MAKAPSATPPPPPPASFADASLEDEAQRRYLNYALSVITSRALPDVRDGLKPVQRRILYTMRLEGVTPDAKHRKSAKIVGAVIGGYHPHGDAAAYEAMVRLAQPWVMRAPLVDGQGNFGSQDGDAAAAYRYTEARLRPIAMELLSELGQRTVDWRPNFDGTASEPVVLPARFPHLLVNGSQGIAVGMATSIPPHNLGEVLQACLGMIDMCIQGKRPELPLARLVSIVRGPDFPTGGRLLASKRELEAVYTSGHGTLKLRGEYKLEEEGGKRAPAIVITSIPYAVERRAVVERVAEVILEKKLQSIVDVRDESTDVVRIVIELRRDADPQLVMAYLYKHTPLQTTVAVNLTCLVPTGEGEACEPKRLSLNDMLRHFLEFRFRTVTRRTEFLLEELKKRIHVLEGLELVFDALDEILAMIRKSEGKADASAQLQKRYGLSEEQAEAILELRLYRLARLEIQIVRKELAEKRAEAKRLDGLLRSDVRRWIVVRDELAELELKYGDKRRTQVGEADEPEFQAEDFIAAEDANVVLTAQGWVKRVRELRDVASTRVREGDQVASVVAGSTRSSVAFFSSQGSAYVCRIHDVPASTGYGDPVQKLFRLADGERIVAAMSFDPRALSVPPATEGAEPEPPHAVAVTKGGLALRFSLRAHRDPSTRSGRKFARVADGDEVLAVLPTGARDHLLCASTDAHALCVPCDELPLLSGPGKGSTLLKLEDGERLVGVALSLSPSDTLTVETDKGRTLDVARSKVEGTRGAKGSLVVRRERFVRMVPPAVVVPTLEVT